MLKIQLQMRVNNDAFDLIVVFYGYVNETNIGFGTNLTRDKLSRF